MEKSSMDIGNRDLYLFYGMLQDRAIAIMSDDGNNINLELFWNDMEFELFRNLAADVTINILSRLPIWSILNCKVVCKEWRDLIKSPEFGSYQPDRRRCLIVFPTTTASFPTSKPQHKTAQRLTKSRNSVNGLLLLLHRHWTEQQQQQHLLLWVCNPITREYVMIPNPSGTDLQLGLPYPPQPRLHYRQRRRPSMPLDIEHRYPDAPPQGDGNYNFGFGVSRTSNQYKVVWISQSECRVYTLGTTGHWRSIAISGPGLLRYNKWNTECAFMYGNLYWLDPSESQNQTEISCFDLETEDFTYFSAPPTRGDLYFECYRSLCAFDDCLCLCDVYGNEIEIWLMRGGEWSKKVAVDEERLRRYSGPHCGYLFPIKDGENGLLLGARCNDSIHYYSNDNGVGGKKMIKRYTRKICVSELDYPRAAVYIPSFHPLGTLFVDEDVRSF